MPKNHKIKLATITVTVSRSRKYCLLPGWNYGTEIVVQAAHEINPKDEKVIGAIFNKIRKSV